MNTTATGKYAGEHRDLRHPAESTSTNPHHVPRHSWEDTDGLDPNAAVRARWLIRQQAIRRRSS
jgi:hypothetical protein